MSKDHMRDRRWALQQKPVQVPVLDSSEADAGELHIQLKLHRPKWQQMLGARGEFERTFVLDAYGREVYESCDGKKKVTTIVKQFARKHKISEREAELSVTTYLKTLIRKGLVAVPVKEKAR